MTKLFHIGAVDPEKGHGGVEQFARDLRDAVDGDMEVEFLTYNPKGVAPWDYAKKANRAMIADGIIGDDDIVVADGFYGLGLEDDVGRLIVVCHGSYAGMLREYAINPPPSYDKVRGWLRSAETMQEASYRAGEVVCVSDNSAEELWEIYGIDAHVIRNGIDTSVYRPGENQPNGVVEVAGNNERKGSDVVAKLREEGVEIGNLGYDGEKHERWQKYEVALFPSRYEGGQYAALEAMATDLKIVAYNSGFFGLDVPEEFVYGTWDYHWRSFRNLINEALVTCPERSPRQWVIAEASIEKFRSEWREFLGVEDG